MCEYTTLQVIVCDYNTSLSDSVAAKKVAIKGAVYDVLSTTSVSTVSVDPVEQVIMLGLTNEQENTVVVHYMIIKEDT